MKLESLRIHGFKSFADSTLIEFHEGITAIVGPNGCGKSNISDAIRWVLGEQRPTAIRGAKMEEAIFQGTVSRRPVNRGSVVMTVSNEDGKLPLPYSEVAIGREVFRDGGSEYTINKAACRLRDVLDLCRDTGLGANAYAIIENRMIDAILSDRADERRGLFEEAAGIGKYKDRRKAATRRLERAEMDLQRLEDVIAEVQTKVRSLARQKGKAERYLEYRKRRLDVELTVVRHQLDGLAARLASVQKELEGDLQTGEGMRAELAAAEAEVESLRLREVDAEKARSEAYAILEAVRTQLVRWERDLAVAEQRGSAAERRSAQIEDERGESREREARLDREATDLAAELDAVRERLADVRVVAEERAAVAGEVRQRLQEARAHLEGVEAQERESVRRGAQLEGDADACDAQAAELERRIESVAQELEGASHAIHQLAAQGDLFAGRLEELAQHVQRALDEVERALTDVAHARTRLDEARTAAFDATEHASSLRARKNALEQLERDREGVEPVLAAVLELSDPGVVGPLAEAIVTDPGTARAVESFLGPVARALVVRDSETLRRLRGWFAAEWKGGGGLVLLPLDRAPSSGRIASGTLLERVHTEGEGAAWVRALLDGVELVDDHAFDAAHASDRVALSGVVTDRRGIVRLGDPTGSSGLLERKELLRTIAAELEEAEKAAAIARATREEAERAFHYAEAALQSARRLLHQAEDDYRGAQAELAAQSDRRTRMDRHRDEITRQLEGAKATRARVIERARVAREEREALKGQEALLHAERESALVTVQVVQEEWETARSEEARLAVDVARLEGEVARHVERLAAVRGARDGERERLAALDREEATLREEIEEVRRIQAEGAAATAKLFAERDAAEAEVRRGESALQDAQEALADAERRAREARTAERAASDRRHELELERQEVSSQIERIRERLEGEWGKPLEALMGEAEPVEGDPEVLREELRELVVALEKLGPVNMLAVEEHEEESRRLAFLSEQRDDLVEARNDLRSAIREINKTATELFQTTFEQIRENFRSTFLRLFEGGEADIWLEDAEDPLESPVEIHASPRGKRTQRIDLLSGGERALTALSLLFGIYLVKPSPFCVLDEVDAPLDENNIGRFIKLLQDFKAHSQFVVITHNPRTIEAADWIYGVTMEEPGVSTIVGVRLEEALQAAGAA